MMCYDILSVDLSARIQLSIGLNIGAVLAMWQVIRIAAKIALEGHNNRLNRPNAADNTHVS
jgi:hypothetical protein